MPAFRFEPSSSLLARYHPTPWISLRALRIRERRRNNWKCIAHSCYQVLQSLTKSSGIKAFLMYGKTGSVGICNCKLDKVERYSLVRHTTQFVKLNIHLGLSTDF